LRSTAGDSKVPPTDQSMWIERGQYAIADLFLSVSDMPLSFFRWRPGASGLAWGQIPAVLAHFHKRLSQLASCLAGR